MPDLEPGGRIEPKVSVERPASKAPGCGELGRVVPWLGVPEAAGGEYPSGEGLRGGVGRIGSDGRPVASREPVNIGTLIGLWRGRRDPLGGTEKALARLAERDQDLVNPGGDESHGTPPAS